MTAYQWNGDYGQSWSTPGNWTPIGAPPNNGTPSNYGDTALVNGAVYADYGLAASVTILSTGAVIVTGYLGTYQVVVDGGLFEVAGNGTLVNATVTFQAGSTMVLESGGTLDAVTWQGTLSFFYPGTTLDIEGGLTVETATGGSPGVIDMIDAESTINILDVETLNTATLDFAGGLNSLQTANQNLTLGSGFTIDQASGYVYAGVNTLGSVGQSGTLTNDGLILDDGGELDVNFAAFVNDGTIEVEGSTARFDASGAKLSSTGLIEVGDGGTLRIGGTAADVTYAGTSPGEVILVSSGSYTGTLYGLALGDKLQLNFHNISAASITTNGTLVVTYGTSDLELDIKVGPGLVGTHFSITEGADGYHSLLTVTTPCFLAGTRILTEHGEIRVEDLQEGDRVMTRDAILEQVRWIGRRRIDIAAHRHPDMCRPIRIRRDAIAPGQPHRDLLVSPDHAIFLDGLLIQARLLVNFRTILQDDSFRHVEYFHMELDRHAIVLAEGLETESYLDTGNRGTFENAEMPLALHPDFGGDQGQREAMSCAPFAVDAARVEPVWRRLAARAEALGHDSFALETTTEPDIRLLVDGRMVSPVAGARDGHLFVLPPRCRVVRLLSRAAAPCDATPWLDDRRRLGVMVAQLTLRQGGDVQVIPPDHPALTEGWWDVEPAGRWTNGDALLPVTGGDVAGTLEVTLAGTMRYPRAAPESGDRLTDRAMVA
jgi:hypothetical protein